MGAPTQAKMDELQLCFTCLFWTEKLEYKNDPRIVRVDGTQYVIGDEDAPRAFRGFGGARFNIDFHDGRKVTSTNLWCNGDIPEHFRAELPDNAVFNEETRNG
jgi:hypothetical protein